MTTNLKPGERLDDLQIKGYEIIQHPGRFCFGMDAVLLSSFAKVKAGERVLDLGTGTGILPILLAAKTDGKIFKALEIQEESADMARRSVLHNRMEDRVEIITGDIKNAVEIFGHDSFDVVTTNPPYMIGGHGLANSESPKTIARHEVMCTLEDIIRQSAGVLRHGGHFYMVHRPFRLVEILSKMSAAGLEPKRMCLVYPYEDKEPNMVLVEGIKGAKSRITVEEPLIVYNKDGSYRDRILELYGMSGQGEKKE